MAYYGDSFALLYDCRGTTVTDILSERTERLPKVSYRGVDAGRRKIRARRRLFHEYSPQICVQKIMKFMQKK
jgi:hypothetical protein